MVVYDIESDKLRIFDLPNELQLMIFDCLDFKSRLLISNVCRLWNVLAFSGRFMDRIALSLDIREDSLKSTMDTLESSVRTYRHVFINFNNQSIVGLDQLFEIIESYGALESLALCGMDKMETIQMQMILRSVPGLVQLYLLGSIVKESRRACLNQFNAIVSNSNDNFPWIDALSPDSTIEQHLLQSLCLVIPNASPLSPQRFKEKFPNLNNLEITCHDPLIAAVFNEYSSQIKRISLLNPTNQFFIAFSEIGFLKLVSLKIDRMELHDGHVIAKFIDFFKNRVDSRTLRHLILDPKFMIRTPIFSTICSHCSSLRELELSLDYMDGDTLKEVTNLKQLQKLSLQGTAYFRDSPRWPHQIRTLSDVRICGSRFPISVLEFIADIAPNLASLALEDLENPEEMFRILPMLVGTIRHFEVGYSKTYERPPSCHPSGYLRSMVNLQSISLRRVMIKHGIQGWLQDSPHLRMVALTACYTLNDTHLIILTTFCPKLKELKLRHCPAITSRGVAGFCSRIPLCTVDTDIRGA